MASGGNKTVLLTGFGGYDKLSVVDRPKPEPGKGEVLVNVRAATINFAELMARQGLYNNTPPLPAVLGLEGAGIVVQLGEGVTDRKIGERVVCLRKFGMWAEFVTLASNQCFPMPDTMTFEEGAAIPVNYVTAYHMLFDIGNLRKNKSVLVHMAAGGVGIAVTQLCKTVENVTLFGTASASKHSTIQGFGVTHPIDYRTKEWSEEVKKISPKGLDIILDPLLGSDAGKAYNLLKPMGKVIHFGAANMVSGQNRAYLQIAKTWWKTYSPSILSMMPQNKCVAGYHMGMLPEETIQEALADLVELYKEKKIKPIIDSVWSFEQIGDAMAQMHDRKNIGKVILTPYTKDTVNPKE